MSSFGAYSPSDVADAADKFISKMDERQLAGDIAAHYAQMPVEGRRALVESILDAFRHRGESSDDVSEATGASVDAMRGGELSAVEALLYYVNQNTGLLKEAAMTLCEDHPDMLHLLPETVVQGITAKLSAR